MNGNKGKKPLYNRKSIRLKGYDYSKAGAYFVTININDRLCLFGKIVSGVMVMNDAGIMINKWWQKIPEKFPDIELGAYQIMPNHFHAIVINNGTGNIVGANQHVRPNDTPNNTVGVDPRVNPKNETTNSVKANPRVHLIKEMGTHPGNTGETQPWNVGQTHGSVPTNNAMGSIHREHMGSPLHAVVQWFKTMSTNEYIRGVKSLDWKPFDGKLWQRNYWESIIRDEKSFQTIANYIVNNPKNWKDDTFYES